MVMYSNNYLCFVTYSFNLYEHFSKILVYNNNVSCYVNSFKFRVNKREPKIGFKDS